MRLVPLATEFHTVAPDVWEFSVRNLLHATLLRLESRVGCWICGKLMHPCIEPNVIVALLFRHTCEGFSEEVLS